MSLLTDCACSGSLLSLLTQTVHAVVVCCPYSRTVHAVVVCCPYSQTVHSIMFQLVLPGHLIRFLFNKYVIIAAPYSSVLSCCGVEFSSCRCRCGGHSIWNSLSKQDFVLYKYFDYYYHHSSSTLCKCVFQSKWSHLYSCRCTEHSSTLCQCVVLCFSVHVEPPLQL